MDFTLAEIMATPLVEMLTERVGGESTEGDKANEIKLTAKFAKYPALEEAAYDFFKHSRDDFLLHFHLESHDRCEVRLKPVLWDKGVYFRPTLLVDGVMRLIPHFIPLISRINAPKKRSLASPTSKSIQPNNPRSQEMSPELSELHTTTPMVNTSEEAPVPDAEEDAGEQDTSSLAAVKSKSFKDRYSGVSYNHGFFRPPRAPPLPQGVTHSSWLTDFAAAKNGYLDTYWKGLQSTHGSVADRISNCSAHAQLIAGRYGMVALKPCDHCVEAGKPCLVYHSQCYEWDTPGQSVLGTFGWRCARCRKNSNIGKGGCNANHDA